MSSKGNSAYVLYVTAFWIKFDVAKIVIISQHYRPKLTPNALLILFITFSSSIWPIFSFNLLLSIVRIFWSNFYMRRKLVLPHLRSYCSCYNCRAVFISHIILNYYNGSNSSVALNQLQDLNQHKTYLLFLLSYNSLLLFL